MYHNSSAQFQLIYFLFLPFTIKTLCTLKNKVFFLNLKFANVSIYCSITSRLARRGAQGGPQGQEDLEDDIEWDDRAENIVGDR